MGSSRWLMHVVAVCGLLVVTSSLSAKYPFVNDFKPYQWEDEWDYSEYPQILIDDMDRVIIFWGPEVEHPLYNPFGQIYYRRFNSYGEPLSATEMINDTSHYSSFTMLLPGGNREGKWILTNGVSWVSPGCWPHCDMGLRCWYSNSDGVMTDTGFTIKEEVENSFYNRLAAAGADSLGNFVVAWTNMDTAVAWCQRFSPEGVPLTDTIRVLDTTCVYR